MRVTDLQSAKDKLYPLLNANQELTDEIRAILNPDQNENFAEFLLTVTNFRELLREVYCQVQRQTATVCTPNNESITRCKLVTV